MDGLFLFILIIAALCSIVYRISKSIDDYHNNQLKETKKYEHLIEDWEGDRPYDAEEVTAYTDHTVYEKEEYKYYKTSSTKSWKRVAEKCPSCGKYLPIVTGLKKIKCPKCGLIMAKSYNERVTWVWRDKSS